MAPATSDPGIPDMCGDEPKEKAEPAVPAAMLPGWWCGWW